MMKIGFLVNQIDNRGTGNALFDYAYYNEEILNNESSIFVLNPRDYDPYMGTKLSRRFVDIHTDWDLRNRDFNLDLIYHIKSGEDDGYRPSGASAGTPYAVHAVFDGSSPHGHRYATISEWMGWKFSIPYVPHIVELSEPSHTLRKQFNIPADAVVFGRHGGADTFDIPWAWDAINDCLKWRKNVYFLFMNTEYPAGRRFHDPERVIFLPPTGDGAYKASFIYACDAMIHARFRGETFGIAVGEFAVAGKPVITFSESPEKAHIQHLGEQSIPYRNANELFYILKNYEADAVTVGQYNSFTPRRVMRRFAKVFLNG
jgi:hypothetical protein